AKRRIFRGPRLGADDFMLRRHDTDNDVLAVLTNALEVGNAGQIDKMGRAREPQLHHRNKTMPAGDCTRVIAKVAEQTDCFLDGRRTVIGKRPRYHEYSSRTLLTTRVAATVRSPRRASCPCD